MSSFSRIGRHRLEQFGACFDGHVEHIRDGIATEFHVQRLTVVTLALADIALDIDVRQKVHLDLDDAIALAGLAAPALDVEREAARRIAARLGLRQFRKPVPDRREGTGIGCGIRARRAADRRLVDVDDLVEIFQPVDRSCGAGMFARPIEPPCGRLVERLDDERRFAAARDAGDAGEGTDRDRGVDILQIVAARAGNLDPAIMHRLAALCGHGNLLEARPGTFRSGCGSAHDVVGRAFGDDLAAVDTGTRAHIDDMIGGADRFLVMFDDDHRIAEIAQALAAVEQPVHCRAGAGRSKARRARRARR